MGGRGPAARSAVGKESGSAERVSGARSGPGTSAGLRQRVRARSARSGGRERPAARGQAGAARSADGWPRAGGRGAAGGAARPVQRGRCTGRPTPTAPRPHPPGKSAVVRLVRPAAGGGGAPARAAGAPRVRTSCRPADTGCQRADGVSCGHGLSARDGATPGGVPTAVTQSAGSYRSGRRRRRRRSPAAPAVGRR